MKVPVTNKSRTKKVSVEVKPSEKIDSLPTPPSDYRADTTEDEPTVVQGCEDCDCCATQIITNSEIVEILSQMKPREVRRLLRAARALRKYNKLMQEKNKDEEEDLDVFGLIDEE